MGSINAIELLRSPLDFPTGTAKIRDVRRAKPLTDPNSAKNVIARVRAIYDKVDARPVTRACERRTICCQFQLSGRTPYLTQGEALLAVTAWKATGRRMPSELGGRCPFLSDPDNKCLIYKDRPFGCRTHFCAEAGGPYARSEVVDLIWELEKLDAELGGRGGVTLETAVREAWSR
jgi:uncharacterized protein